MEKQIYLVARLTGLASALIIASALTPLQAQEIYKWKDANGTVHYGDRSAAPPDDSKKMDVAVTPPRQPHLPPLPQTAPPMAAQQKSVPVDPARVGPQCAGLIEKIAAVPAGRNWEGLSRQFNRACPGIAYECKEYRSNPQDNQCAWVEKSGNTLLRRIQLP